MPDDGESYYWDEDTTSTLRADQQDRQNGLMSVAATSWPARPVGFPKPFQSAPEEHGNASDWKELPSWPFAEHRWNGAYLSAPRRS